MTRPARDRWGASDLNPMRHKHSHRVRIVWVNMEDVRLAQKVSQHEIVLSAVPLASDPADVVHQTQSREFRNDQILGPFAIEFHQVDIVDPKVRYLRPELLNGKRWNFYAELSESRLKRFPDVWNIIGDPTVRYGERQQALSSLGRDRCVDPQQLRIGNVTGVLGHQLKALRMWLDGHDLGLGPVVVGHNSKAPHVRTDVKNRANVMGTKVIDSVLVMKNAVSELHTLGLDMEVLPIDFVANGSCHR